MATIQTDSHSIFLFCRQGFEKDCAAEIIDYASFHGVYGHCKTKPNLAYVLFISSNGKKIAVTNERVLLIHWHRDLDNIFKSIEHVDILVDDVEVTVSSTVLSQDEFIETSDFGDFSLGKM